MSKPEKLLEFQFKAVPENLCRMRQKLKGCLEQCRLSEEAINCMVLAVCEASMNIIQHAYCNTEPGDIIVEVERVDGNLLFRLSDFALHHTRVEEMKPRPLDQIRPGGLGCHIINEIMDEVKLVDCSNQACTNMLQMMKCIEDGNHLPDTDEK